MRNPCAHQFPISFAPTAMTRPLFRQEALDGERDKLYGVTLLARPVSLAVLTIAAVLMAAAIIGFMAWGEYTRKEHVTGYLAPSKGLIKVYTPQAGLILERRIAEGQVVERGDVLFVISSERSTDTTREAQAAMLREVRERRDSLKREQAKQAEIDELAVAGLNERMRGLEAELAQAQAQLNLQRKRVASAERTVERHEQLAAARFVSDATLQQKQEELLEQRGRLASVQRSISALARDLNAVRTELAASGPKRANNAAAMQRAISELEQQLTEADTRRVVVLTASAAGRVTTILGEVGQTANPGSPLLSILPAGAELEAHLLIPTRAAGFIKSSQPVALRYQAFPYQRFGHHLGEVSEIGRTVMLPSESSLPLAIREPVYRVTVRLPAQQVTAYGQQLPLQAGMILDADIRVDRRRLIEWVFDPVYAITGRI